MGASVTAIDAAPESVGVGAAHALRDPLVAARTRFIHTTAEQLVAEGARLISAAFQMFAKPLVLSGDAPFKVFTDP